MAFKKNKCDKSHNNHQIQVGDRVLISTVNFQNLGGKNKLKDMFILFFVKVLNGLNAVEFILTEVFNLKCPSFPISFVKKYEAKEEEPSPSPQIIPL